MTGLALFRTTLLLPVAIPAISLLLRLEVAGFLGIATFVAAAPYMMFACWAWRHMGRCSSYREAYIFLAKAPIIFATPICFLWLCGSLVIEIHFPTAITATTKIFAVLVGTAYLYCAIASLLVMSARASGVVSEFKKCENTIA